MKVESKSVGRRVQELLGKNRGIMTATEIGKLLNVRLDTLSSVLKKLTTSRDVQRVPGHGKRGGYGYRLNPIFLSSHDMFELLRIK